MSPKKVDNRSRYNQLEAGTQRARPVLHEHAKEIQPYNKIAKLPLIALDEVACESSVEKPESDSGRHHDSARHV